MRWLNKSVFGLTAFFIAAQCWAGLDLERQISFNIPAQQLDAALVDFSRQTKLQVVTSGEDVKKRKSGGVTGTYTIAEALQRLLNSSGLSFKPVGDSAISIGKFTKPAETAAVDVSLLQVAGETRLARAQERKDESASTGAAAASDETQAAEDKGTVIIVTGSRLRGGDTTSPVTVITMEQIKAQGINSVEDIIRSLPQNYANITPTSALDNSSSVGTLGNAAANLRGLGEDGTLVLVNGRRVAGSTVFSGSTVNLNTIPFSAIERVEVLTDGASAIYGADAVAGVINFILRKGYDSPEVSSLRYDASSNGGDVRKFQQSLGSAWGSGSFSGSLSYEDRDPVSSAKVGWTSLDQRSRGGDDWRASLDNGSSYQPGAIYGPSQLVDLHDLYPAFYPVGTLYEVPGPLLGAVNPTRDASVPITLADLSTGNLRPYDDVRKNQSDERKGISAHFHVDQDLTDAFSGYAEVSYTRNKSKALTSPLTLIGVTIPASNAFNNTGDELGIDYAFSGEAAAGLIPYSVNINKSRNITAVLGFNARLPFADWKSEGYVNYSVETTYSQAFDEINEDALAAALADSNPATALNLFGDGTQQNPQTVAGLYKVADDPYAKPTTTDGRTKQVNLSANGSLFSLPAGKVAGVLGLDYRNEYRQYDAYIGTTLSTKHPERDTEAVFSELNIPLIGAANRLPLVHSLEIRAAARWEEYAIEGPFDGLGSASREITYSNVSPSIGLAWRLTPEFKLRVNKGESFKVPRLDDLFTFEEEPRIVGYVADVLASSGAFDVDPITHLAIDPISGLPIPEYGIAFGGNPEVEPEKSDTLSFGFDWTPSGMLQGMSVSLSYVQIKTRDVIGDTFNLLFDEPDFYIRNYVARNPDGTIAFFAFKPVNFSFEGAKAVDLYVTHQKDTRHGQFEFGMSGSYTLERYSQYLATSERTYSDGTLSGPDHLKLRNWLTWSKGNHGGTLTMNYISAYDNDSPEGTGGARPPQRVPSYTTFDVTAHYDAAGYRILGGVRNLLDQEFPFLLNRTPFDPRRVDINGRVIFLEVSKSFNLL